jgi:hypothetical protein
MGSAATSNSGSRVAGFLVTTVVLIVAAVVAKMFVPWYRLKDVNFDAIAQKAQVRPDFVRKEYDVTMCYRPRGETDPNPWLLVTMKPTWAEATGDPEQDETGFARRCNFISEKDGYTVSKFWLGSMSPKDLYWSAKAWRLPPNALPGKSKDRPVILYRAGSLEKMSFAQSDVLHSDLRDSNKWEIDDDEWTPPEKPTE